MTDHDANIAVLHNRADVFWESAMEYLASSIIRDEHSALSAMLRSIVLLLEKCHRCGTLPDFCALRAMLFYVDEFPERLHHTKESAFLFPKLRARSTEATEVLDRLYHEHACGERVLTDADWGELDAAFQQNRDPLVGHEPDGKYRPLFKKILMKLAPPIGLGGALEAMAATGHHVSQ